MAKKEFSGKIVRVGNSYGVRIPSNIVKELGLKDGSKIKAYLKPIEGVNIKIPLQIYKEMQLVHKFLPKYPIGDLYAYFVLRGASIGGASISFKEYNGINKDVNKLFKNKEFNKKFREFVLKYRPHLK